MKVVIYGAEYCPYCIRAKRLAERKGLDYEYILVEGATDPKLIEKFPDATTIPQITIDNRHVGGYDDFNKELMG